MAGIADLQQVKKWIGMSRDIVHPERQISCTLQIIFVGWRWGGGGPLRILTCLKLIKIVILKPERSRLDPNDPRNAELLQLVASIPSSAEQETYFRLVDVDDVERFVPDSLIESDRRFTLLQLRDQGVHTLMKFAVSVIVKS